MAIFVGDTITIPRLFPAMEADAHAAEKPAALLAVGGEYHNTVTDLLPGVITLGRHPENNVVLECHCISRHHLKLTVTEEGMRVVAEDLGSRNGTYLNEAPLLRPSPLNKGDVLRMGSLTFKFLPKGDGDRLLFDTLQSRINTDSLTKAFTKAYFIRHLDLEWERARHAKSPIAVVIFDLDLFKRINDTYGHDAGDFALQELGRLVWRHGVREQDLFARYGGEEFVILLPGHTLNQAIDIAERVRRLVAEHLFVYNKQLLPVTISLGIAANGEEMQSGMELFKKADTALYKAKAEGRNRLAIQP